MNDSNKERPASNIIRAKSDRPSEPPQPIIPVTQKKRRHLVSLIVLMLLAAITVIVCLMRPVVAERYEGVGVALCVVTCGVFLVRRVIRLMKAEDKMQEQQFDVDQTTISPPEPNPAGQEANRTTPSPEAGQNIK